MELYVIHTAEGTEYFCGWLGFGFAVAYCMDMIRNGIEVWGSDSPIREAKRRLATEVELNQGAYI